MKYRRYEEMKAAWISNHPGASSKEYEIAIRAIARECGI